MTIKFRITGIVQGVGFRPFVYKIAKKNNLAGWVLNDNQGVLLLVKGFEADIEHFTQELRELAPPMSVIDTIKNLPLNEEDKCFLDNEFRILSSAQFGEHQVFISPDIATCDECIGELLNPSDRRHKYPFINCTNCGPRYSIIEDVPYDRPKTTMKKFKMCADCTTEYKNPLNRRFHAQPNACDNCGPQYILQDISGKTLENPINTARNLIMEGKIVAVKGIGGYHLVCDARNALAVQTLRKRKHRETKPLAVMVRTLEQGKKLCYINNEEEKLLTSFVAPIVLLEKREDICIAEAVAPNNPYLGVMLPYAPIHYLLLENEDVFVMTSANISEEPIIYKDTEVFEKLKGIADFVLSHNREIAYRVDDSIVRVIKRKNSELYPLILRRSRGMVPTPLKFIDSHDEIMAYGAELKNTFCITKGNIAFVSEHIGDLANLPIYNSYKNIIAHYEKIFEIKPSKFACDMHPNYLASEYARQNSDYTIEVQHHHAHIASVLAEHGIAEKVIGVAFDGTGYGTDGTIWGGEFLVADLKSFTREAHLAYIPLPGGDKAAKEPWRQALFYMHLIYGEKLEKILNSLPKKGLKSYIPSSYKLLIEATKAGLNSPFTSSMGRLFDAVSASLGLCEKNTYEGEAAITLELMATKAKKEYNGKILPYKLEKNSDIINGGIIIDAKPIIKSIFEEGNFGCAEQNKIACLALDFHMTIADIIKRVTSEISRATRIKTVVLAGGVFQNKLLLETTLEFLESDYKVLLPKKLPINDGGLSFGQVAIASKRRDINVPSCTS